MTFGDRLKNCRIDRGFTQQEFGDLLKVCKATVCLYEKNLRQPSLNTIIDICTKLNVSADYLLGIENLFKKNKRKQKNDEIDNIHL